jgi:hypothetical protein
MEANYRLVFMEDLLTISRRLTAHGLWFGIFFILSLLPFWRPLNALLHLSLHDDRYSHILLIPLMSVSLVYLRRERIFAFLRYCPSKSAPLLVVGGACQRL